MDRAAFLTHGISQDAFGIEIGPFYSPVAAKARGWKTTVVDFTDQAGLLDIARTHSAQTIREMAGNIEEVDVVWRGQEIDKACLALRAEGFTFLIASHVIEHIPDVVSFLRQISNLANDDFVLSLAVPDCRRTFDFFKPLSTTADALLAWRQKRTLHSPETIFTGHAYGVWVGRVAAWLPGQTGSLYLPDSLERSHSVYMKYVENLEAGTQSYMDSHCWYWTPSSFELMMIELNHLGYIDFFIDEIEPQPSSEFLVRLKKGKLNLDKDSLQSRRLELLMQTRCELAENQAMALVSRQDENIGQQLLELQNKHTFLNSKCAELQIALTEARTRLKSAQETICELETSTSWKVTSPLRRIKRMLA